MSTHAIPVRIVMQESDDPADLLEGLAAARFVAGEHRWARTVSISRARADATLLPDAVIMLRTAVEETTTVHFAVGDGWTVRVRRWRDRSASVQVTAVDEATGERVLADGVEGAEEPKPVDGRLAVRFWHMTKRGPARAVRLIAVEPWESIRGNYSGRVAHVLDRVMTVDPTSLAGRILLLHGPPGTGKTTAIRALGDAWRSWATVEYIADPERLFDDAGYLMRAAMGESEDDDCEHDACDHEVRWRLLVLEDCDELIRAGAKKDTGQALARLLNLTDGMLGQGLRVLVCITTNEPLSTLHPAVVRPGRCLAEVEVGKVSHTEASRWLGSGAGVPADGMTLAELLERRGSLREVDRIDDTPKVAGLYL